MLRRITFASVDSFASAFPALAGVVLAVCIPFVVVSYRRFRGSPSNREKGAWLYFVSLVVFLHSVIGIYDLAPEAYYAVLPVIVGVTIGACFVLAYYVFAYGWIDSADSADGRTGSTSSRR